VAQAFIPPERTQVAGVVFPGDNYANAIKAEVLNRLNSIQAYR